MSLCALRVLKARFSAIEEKDTLSFSSAKGYCYCLSDDTKISLRKDSRKYFFLSNLKMKLLFIMQCHNDGENIPPRQKKENQGYSRKIRTL